MKKYTVSILLMAAMLSIVLSADTAQAASLTWNNGNSDMLWNTSSANWGGATLWNNGTPDSATFGTTGAGTITVDAGGVTQAGITISAGSYTFTGGSIGGTGTVTMSSSGALYLGNRVPLVATNTFTGGIVLNAGTLLGMNAGFNTNNLIVNGNSTLDAMWEDIVNVITLASITLNNSSILSVQCNTKSVTCNGPVTGNGGISLTQSGGGSTTVNLNSTANTFTGPIYFNLSQAGTLNVNSLSDAVGSGRIVYISSSAASLVYSTGAIAPLVLNNRQIEFAGASGTIQNNNATVTNTITIKTPLLISAAGNKTLTLGGSNSGNNSFAGAITNGSSATISIYKNDGCVWALGGTNTYTGDTFFMSTLIFQGAKSVSPSTKIVMGQSGNSATGSPRFLDDGLGTVSFPNLLAVRNGQNGGGHSHTIFVGNNGIANGGSNPASTVTRGIIAFANMILDEDERGRGGAWNLNITGANGYRLQLGNVTLDWSPGDWSTNTKTSIIPATAPVTITGTVILKSGANVVNPYTLVLDGTASGNLISGPIMDPADYPANANASPLSVTKSSTSTWTLSGTNTYTGTNTLTAGTLSISQDVNLGSSNSLVFNGGTLRITGTNLTTYASGLLGTHPVILTSGQAVGLNIADPAHTFTVSQALSQGSGGLTKSGAGTLALSAVNTYSGTTTINGGTLKLRDVGSGLTQSLGTLSLSGPDVTLVSENAGSGTLSTTFTTLSRTAGSSANIIFTGANNLINLTQAAGFIDKGVFVSGADYAAMNAANTYIRALAYGTDPSTVAINTITTVSHVKLTTSPAAQNTLTLFSLNLAGSGINYTQNDGQTLTVPAILKSGGGAGTVSGGAGLQAGNNVELVIRTDTASDSLVISTPILAQGANALTKSGAGTLALSATNTYTGATAVNAGTLSVTGAGLLGSGSYAADIAIASGAVFSYGSSTNQIISGIISGSGSLVKEAAGKLTLTATNTYTGAMVINSGTLEIAGSGLLGNGIYAGSITNSGILLYNSSSTQVVTGVIAGNGTTKINAGTFCMQGQFANWARVRVETGAKLVLNFSGTNTIFSLYLNGIPVYGVWGPVGSGAINESSLLTGTGIVSIPLPAGTVITLR